MRLFVFLLLLTLPGMALADSAMPDALLANRQLEDPVKEAQAKALMETVRCVVCQGQSVADSNAEIAGDMRSLIRTRIKGGETPEQVRHWLIERYGDYISYDPPLSSRTAPLWIMPILLLLLGSALAWGRFRKGKK